MRTGSRAPLENLKVSGNLPTMPQILVHLIDACHQEEVDLHHVSRLVAKDAALAAKVLRLCNSAFIGARSAFVDIRQAVIYLGANTIKNLAISVSVQQIFRRVEANGLLNIDRFWYHSYQNGILARRIAEKSFYPNPSEAYLAGLLHDVGKLVLWMAFPGKYAPLLLKGIRCHNGRLAFLEKEKLDLSHCEAGAWLIREWGLPPAIAEAIEVHHHPVDEVAQGLPISRIVFLADLASHSEDPAQECDEVAHQFFRFPAGTIATLSHGVEERIHEVADEMGIRIPAKSRSSLESEPESETIHRETSIGLISRIRDITQLTGLLDNLLKAEDREQMALFLEQSLQILFGVERCLLLLLNDQENGCLAGFCSMENPLYPVADSLSLDPRQHQGSLVARALELHQPLHSFINRPEEENTLLDSQLSRLMERDGIMVVPLVYRRNNLGVLIIGLKRDTYLNVVSHATPLQLLAAQAAVTLTMEQWRQARTRRMAAERLEAAAMVARKIGHEINNPLSILRNYLKILKLKIENNETITDELVILDKEFERISRLTHQLSDLSSDAPLKTDEPIDLRSYLEELVGLFRSGPDFQEGNMHLDLEIAPDFPETIRTDANALRQILINLLNNSCEALEGQGDILVSAGPGQESGTMVIRVRDTGPGIHPDLRSTLFQAGTSSKKGGHGGLGLAIAARLAQRMGGRIELGDEKQTTFHVILPLCPA